MEQTRSGYAVWTAFLARGIEGGSVFVVFPSEVIWRFFLGGLLRGLRGCVDVSVSVSEGVGGAEW